MREELYLSSAKCPVCTHKFDVFKVKTGFAKVVKRDTDFYTQYDVIDPLWYDVWVCEKCGYAEQQQYFDDISRAERLLIEKSITPKWTKRGFYATRDIDKVIEMFKLAYLNHHVRNSKGSSVARICIRLAWLYRSIGDEREFEYLRLAVRGYRDAFSKEVFPIGKLDSATCTYMIAELYRRLREYELSVEWFSMYLTNPDSKRNASVFEMAQEQAHLAKKEKKEYDESKLKDENDLKKQNKKK